MAVSQRRHLNGASAGAGIFIIGGMDMAQSLGWNLASIYTTHELEYIWFIGMILGLLLTPMFTLRVPKLGFYIFGSVLTLIEGILFVSAPHSDSAILAARLVGGLGVGVVTVPYIVHSTEVARKDNRGLYSSMEQYSLTLGVLIQILYSTQWAVNVDWTDRFHGIAAIVISVCSLLSILMNIESPIFHLRRNEEEKACVCQQQLHRCTVATQESDADLVEAKMYVIEGSNQTSNEELRASVIPFIKLVLMRCFVAFSFSLPLTYALRSSSYEALGSYYGWPIIVAPILRLIGATLAVCVLDRFGRKFVSLLGLIFMAGLMLGMAGIYAQQANVEDNYYMWVECSISMAYQFFAGFYISSTPTYLGEAFPMRAKETFISIIVSLEQVIHIIVICSFDFAINDLFVYFLVVGIILGLGAISLALMMPETSGMTLREAGQRFQLLYDFKSF